MSQELLALLEKRQTLMSEQESLERDLKEVLMSLNRVNTIEIPDLLSDMGLTELKLEDGRKVSLKPFVSVKIAEEKKDEAFEWLINNGQGDILQHEFKIHTPGSELAAQEEMRKKLSSEGVSFEEKMSVHHMTMQAHVKELLKTGFTFPDQLFSVYQGKIATVK